MGVFDFLQLIGGVIGFFSGIGFLLIKNAYNTLSNRQNKLDEDHQELSKDVIKFLAENAVKEVHINAKLSAIEGTLNNLYGEFNEFLRGKKND